MSGRGHLGYKGDLPCTDEVEDRLLCPGANRGNDHTVQSLSSTSQLFITRQYGGIK